MGLREIMYEDFKAEGRAEGIAEAILLILQQRGVEVDASFEARLRRTNAATLKRWVKRAIEVRSVQELVEG